MRIPSYKLMLSFIQTFNKVDDYEVLNVTNIKVKDEDDDNGSMNEHFYVTCEVVSKSLDEIVDVQRPLRIQCMIPIKTFEDWHSNNAVFWI